VIEDRPGVGQGMQEHIFLGPTYRVKVDTLARLANDPLYAASQFAIDYIPRNQTGRLHQSRLRLLRLRNCARDLITLALLPFWSRTSLPGQISSTPVAWATSVISKIYSSNSPRIVSGM
jgi:hypothetical protein